MQEITDDHLDFFLTAAIMQKDARSVQILCNHSITGRHNTKQLQKPIIETTPNLHMYTEYNGAYDMKNFSL